MKTKNTGKQHRDEFEVQLLKDLLESYGFYEEVEGKMLKELDTLEANDEYNNCACWYIESDKYYWYGDAVIYSEFRTLLDDYINYRRENAIFAVDEDEMNVFVSSLECKIKQLCAYDYTTPKVLLKKNLELWVKYNNLLKRMGASHYTPSMEKHLRKLVAIKVEYDKTLYK